MDESEIRPTIWYYGLSVLVIIAGFVIFADLVFSNISNMGGDLLQIAAPGSSDIYLDEPGEYTVYYEYQTFYKNEYYRTSESLPDIMIYVYENSTGRHLNTYPSVNVLNYSIGNRNGQSILAFKTDHPGIYRINTLYPDRSGPNIVLAVGSGFAEGIISQILISLAALFASIAIGIIIAFTTYTRRKKAINQMKVDAEIMRGGR